ncbi:P-loop containing nucleoside triphosphate hydrolase protein, partial [Lasiosphaeria hispida]
VPHTQNPRFCGRDTVLSSLHEFLTGNSEPDCPSRPRGLLGSCLVHGMGGVGKTQIAIEYTYRYRSSYDFIFWVSAENETVLQSSAGRILNSLGLLPANKGAEAGSLVESLRKWLENAESRWLLVLDNAENTHTLVPCLPRTNHGAVLITSQHDRLFSLVAHDIQLEPLDPDKGSEFFCKHLKTHASYDFEGAKIISEQLGGLPLALGYVAGYISDNKWSLREFLKYESENPQILASILATPQTAINQYNKTLVNIWESSSRRLDPAQRKVIEVLSMLNPDGTPEEMLYAKHDELNLAFLSSDKLDLLRFSEMIGHLTTWHLIRRETVSGKPLILIHRSLQKVVIYDLEKNPALLQKTFDIAFGLVRKVYPQQSPTHDPQNGQWGVQKLFQPLVLSLQSVYSATSNRLAAPIEFAELLSDAAYYNYESDTLADGQKLTDAAEAICKGLPDSQHSNVVRANVYSLAAVMRWGHGISTRNAILHRFLQAQALLQKHINELNPDEATPEILRLYATGWNDIAHIFIEHEFYEDAIQLLNLCAAIKRRVGDQFGVQAANRNKALALVWSGRFSEALMLVPDEADIFSELLSPHCASYYERCRFAWANILLIAGRYQRAFSLLEKNLESRKILHGDAGRLTLDSHFLLGVVQCKMGNPQEAIKNFTAALDNARNWSVEAETLARHHLSKALRGVGRHGEARKHELETTATKAQLCGKYGIHLPQAGVSDDEIYDHLASSEMGRTTVGGFQGSGKLPRLMSLCEEIQRRLGNLGEEHVSAALVLRACKGG